MYNILTYTYLLLPISLFFTKKKWKNIDILTIGIYGLVAFIYLYVDVVSLPVKYQKLYVFSYTAIEYLFFSIILWLNINNKGFKQLIIFLSAAFIIFQILFYYLVSRVDRLDSIPVGIETILVFIYIFFFFYEAFKNPKTDFIYNHPCFWIAIGILIYLGGAFFFYILANHMAQAEVDKYWDITYVAEILKNVLFAISMFLFSSKLKENKITSSSKLPYLDMN